MGKFHHYIYLPIGMLQKEVNEDILNYLFLIFEDLAVGLDFIWQNILFLHEITRCGYQQHIFVEK